MVDLCVEFLYLLVRRGRGAETGVSFNNESFSSFSEVRYHVRDVTLGDMVLCGDVRILQNKGSPVLQEEGGPERAKDSSASRVYESQSAIFRSVKV